jgi:predicted ATPase
VKINEEVGDPLNEVMARMARAHAQIQLGELQPALADLTRGADVHDAEAHGPILQPLVGFDVGLCIAGYSGLVRCLLGQPHQAIDQHERTVGHALTIEHLFSRYIPLYTSSFTYGYLDEAARLEENARRLLDLAAQSGWDNVGNMGRWLEGWAMTKSGELDRGIAGMREAEAAYFSTSSHSFRTLMAMALVEALLRASQLDEAAEVLDDVLAYVERSGEGLCEVDCHRLKGELLASRGDGAADIDACFRRATDLARQRQTKLQELKATTSWARWLDQQGQREEARRMLAGVHGWFTEGFDTEPLREASALLERLAATTRTPD